MLYRNQCQRLFPRSEFCLCRPPCSWFTVCLLFMALNSLSPGLSWPHRFQSKTLTVTSTQSLPPCSCKKKKKAKWDQRRTPCAAVVNEFALYRPQLKLVGLSCLCCSAHSSFPSYTQKISGSKFLVGGGGGGEWWGSGNCSEVFVPDRNSPERSMKIMTNKPRQGCNALPLTQIRKRVCLESIETIKYNWFSSL